MPSRSSASARPMHAHSRDLWHRCSKADDRSQQPRRTSWRVEAHQTVSSAQASTIAPGHPRVGSCTCAFSWDQPPRLWPQIETAYRRRAATIFSACTPLPCCRRQRLKRRRQRGLDHRVLRRLPAPDMTSFYLYIIPLYTIYSNNRRATTSHPMACRPRTHYKLARVLHLTSRSNTPAPPL